MIRNTYILKTISLFLSFWMLCASAGLSIDFHYCEGKIVDWSITGQELECHHDKEGEKEKMDSCCKASQEVLCHESETNSTKSNCCDTDEAEVIIENEFNISSENIEFSLPLLLFTSYFIQEKGFSPYFKIPVVQQQKPPIPINRKLAILETFVI